MNVLLQCTCEAGKCWHTKRSSNLPKITMAACVRANCDYMLYFILSLSAWILSNHLCIPAHHTSFSQADTSFVLIVALNRQNEMPNKKVLRSDTVKFSRTFTENLGKYELLLSTGLPLAVEELLQNSQKEKEVIYQQKNTSFLPLGFSPWELPEAAVPATLLWERSRAGSIHLLCWQPTWLLANFAFLISKQANFINRPPFFYNLIFFSYSL